MKNVHKFPDVSVAIAVFKPDKEILDRLINTVKNQDYPAKIEVLAVDKGMGYAESMNYGVRKAKHPIIITLHQDCIPEDDKWMKKLVGPLVDDKFVVSVSKVLLPYEWWKKYTFLTRLLTAKEQKVITSLMDEKGCAYHKGALFEVGLFDEKTFRTAGEDFDTYIKLKKIGDFAYPDIKVLHYHIYNFKGRIKKELQFSEAFGSLVRKYGFEMPGWHVGFVKSIPIIGFLPFLFQMPIVKMGISSLVYILLVPVLNFIYSFGFWKGFVLGVQKDVWSIHESK